MRKNAIISAAGNFSTAYNLIVINIVKVLVTDAYCPRHLPNQCTSLDRLQTLATTASLAGAILGQLTFGYVGDCLGRSPALRLTMLLSIAGALASAFAVPLDDQNPASVFLFLAITRFVLGVGVGGVYPLSATIASESASDESRGRTAALVFSLQGVAALAVPLVAYFCLFLGEPTDAMGWPWRLTLGLGALPGILLSPFSLSKARDAEQVARGGRAQIASSEQSVWLSVSGTVADSAPAPSSPRKLTLMEALRLRAYHRKLLGTAGGWFLFDIVFYGNTLFQETVIDDVFGNTTSAVPSRADEQDLCTRFLVIASIALPGYYCSVWLMDSLGRRNIQLQGFFFMAILFVLLGALHPQLESVPLLELFIYGLTFFFANFGPNTTTFMLPAETFPPHLRSTMNGVSAAMGKLGATIGAAIFKPISSVSGLGLRPPAFAMLGCAVVSLGGMVITYYCVEDRRGKGMEGSMLEPQATEQARILAARSDESGAKSADIGYEGQ